MMKEAISKIEKGHHLDTDEAEQLLCHIFQNETQEPELKSLLGLLIQKGESVSEIIGFARAMRKSMATGWTVSKALRLHARFPRRNIELCDGNATL